MRMYDLIEKKREGGALTDEEIDFMITGYTKGDIPDYQMSAMMMAIYFQGMNKQETLDLTLAMADSGDHMDLSGIQGYVFIKIPIVFDVRVPGEQIIKTREDPVVAAIGAAASVAAVADGSPEAVAEGTLPPDRMIGKGRDH